MSELYQDGEKVLVAWVKTVPGVVGAGTLTKDNLESTLPFVRVARIGGQDDGVTDSGVYDFDVFAATRQQAWEVAETIRARLRPRTRSGTAIIDAVRTSTAPRTLPWANSNIQRYSATYGITLRR